MESFFLLGKKVRSCSYMIDLLDDKRNNNLLYYLQCVFHLIVFYCIVFDFYILSSLACSPSRVYSKNCIILVVFVCVC